MGYEFRNKLSTTARVVVAVATALLMAGCAGAAPVAATPANTSAPSSGSLAPAFIPPSPVETTTAAGGDTLTAAALAPSTKKPTVAPKPATTAASATWAACSATLGGVAVHVAAQQRTATIVKGKGGSYATLVPPAPRERTPLRVAPTR